MKRYSAFAIAREATRYHSGWERAWRAPEPKTKYDAIIIGAGGHGLATAYYLGKNFGITNVAIIEKGWLGGVTQGAIRPSFAQTTFKTRLRRSMRNRAPYMRRCPKT